MGLAGREGPANACDQSIYRPRYGLGLGSLREECPNRPGSKKLSLSSSQVGPGQP